MGEHIHAGYETCLGCVLVSAPFWERIISDVNATLGFIALACGAVLGIHGVWRLLKNHQRTGHW